MAASVIARFERPEPLLRGVLIRRYKRFLCDVRMEEGDDAGKVVVAHCVNTGAMEGLTTPGTPVYLSKASSPSRKLRYTWELAEIDGTWIGTNTAVPNVMFRQFLEARVLPAPFDQWTRWASERVYGDRRRIDFVVECGKGRARQWHYVEVKNCHLVYPDNRAYFPDCVSERATAHLHELRSLATDSIAVPHPFAKTAEPGKEARIVPHVFFFVQIPHVIAVRPSDLHDAIFAKTAREVADAGVVFHAVTTRQTATEVEIVGYPPVDLKPYDTAPVAAFRQAANDSRS